MTAPRSAIIVVACASALGLGYGCSADDSRDVETEPVAKPTAAQPSPQARRALARRDSAAAAAVAYWRSVQRGALPISLSLYATQVVDVVGLANFAGTLAAQRPLIRHSRLNVVHVEYVSNGSLITAEALPTTGPKTEHSFFLRKQEDRWRVLYDTFTATAVQQFVTDQTQRSLNVKAPPSTPAVRAGDRALTAYRHSALSLIRDARR